MHHLVIHQELFYNLNSPLLLPFNDMLKILMMLNATIKYEIYTKPYEIYTNNNYDQYTFSKVSKLYLNSYNNFYEKDYIYSLDIIVFSSTFYYF